MFDHEIESVCEMKTNQLKKPIISMKILTPPTLRNTVLSNVTVHSFWSIVYEDNGYRTSPKNAQTGVGFNYVIYCPYVINTWGMGMIYLHNTHKPCKLRYLRGKINSDRN